MKCSAPRIDSRTVENISDQIQLWLKDHGGRWNEINPKTKKVLGLSGALIGVFGKYTKLIIEGLNQAPEKNFLAFLDLLGAAPLPPQPARVPLTFSMAPGFLGEVVVPAGTQVAAPPGEGDQQPIVFETEENLVVTSTRVESVGLCDPHTDQYAEWQAVLPNEPRSALPLFTEVRPVEHALYIGNESLLSQESLKEMRVTIQLEEPHSLRVDDRKVQWEIWDGQDGIPLIPQEDQTLALARSGVVVFAHVPKFPRQTIESISSRWLRCRLLTPITHGYQRREGMVRANQLPWVKDIMLQAIAQDEERPVEAGFANSLALDLSKDFFPFGQNPQFGDVLYLASAKIFSIAGGVATLSFTLSNPIDGDSETPIPLVTTSGNPYLRWEVWDETTWVEAGTGKTGEDVQDAQTGFQDTTQALTRSGRVVIPLPSNPRTVLVHGIENMWVRARLVKGNYGEEASYEPKDPEDLDKGYRLKTKSLSPPAIRNINAAYNFPRERKRPEVVLRATNFIFENVTGQLDDSQQSFSPFRPINDPFPSIHIGLNTPTKEGFPNYPLSLFFDVEPILVVGRDAAGEEPSPPLFWEYWNEEGWESLEVLDRTQAFSKPGIVRFLPPSDWTPNTVFRQKQYWLKVHQKESKDNNFTRLQRVTLNTAMACHAITFRDEILGSSDGRENQVVSSLHTPILLGQQVVIRESEVPSETGRMANEQESGFDVIKMKSGQALKQENWVRWNEVPDFYGSGPHDRHYVLDRMVGEIQFGDGLQGKIPSVGRGNIRLALYQVGGGLAGNTAVGSITQLKTAIPHIAAVTNLIRAVGGADGETLEKLKVRAPKEHRHRDRAVTKEDYEDLAMQASPAVARALCMPLYEPGLFHTGMRKCPGSVTVFILPHSQAFKPVPTRELLDQVRSFLEKRCDPGTRLHVTGPPFIGMDLQVEIVPRFFEEASTLSTPVGQALTQYLHPLTGGSDGEGWGFGRQPHRSDLLACIQAVEGVDYVRSLQVQTVTDEGWGMEQTEWFVLYPNKHQIMLVTQ